MTDLTLGEFFAVVICAIAALCAIWYALYSAILRKLK